MDEISPMIHHGETEIAPIFRTDSSVLIQKELSLMPMGASTQALPLQNGKKEQGNPMIPATVLERLPLEALPSDPVDWNKNGINHSLCNRSIFNRPPPPCYSIAFHGSISLLQQIGVLFSEKSRANRTGKR